jgi:hypothetical protein
MNISLSELQEAVKRCEEAEPTQSGELSVDMQCLAKMLGDMIWLQREGRAAEALDLSSYSVEERAVLERWLLQEKHTIAVTKKEAE